MIARTIALLGLLLSLVASPYAQKNLPGNPEDPFFDLPHYSIEEAYYVDLGKGNYLKLELVDRSALTRFQNLDSLLLVVIGDLSPFKDSLADPLSGKRIDYRIDSAGRKMVRIRETRSPGTSFLLGEPEPSLLRLRQDTISILLPETKGRFNRLTLVINRIGDLQNWVATGLNTKMQALARNGKYTWSGGTGKAYLKADPTIRQTDDSIYANSHHHDYLELDAIISLQNYKNWLTPSVDLGAAVGFHDRRFIHEIGLYWEPLFLFGSDAHGQLQTYRNDLLVLRYAFDAAGAAKDPLRPVGLNTNITIGYLIHRTGGFFEKDSWRLTAGELRLRGNRIVLQPCIYFNNLFKDVTPGLRLCYRAF